MVTSDNLTVSRAKRRRPWTIHAVCVALLLLTGATTAHALAAAPPAVSFAARTPFDVGLGARATAVADLNRDGVPDLAVVNSFDDTVSVLLGNVSAPGTYLPAVDYNTPTEPWDIVIADINRDGVLDLVIINCTCDAPLSIFYGLGDGTFDLRQDHMIELFSPFGLAVADLNRDGVLDVAISDDSMDTVAVLLGNVSAPGSFQDVEYYPVGAGAGTVRIADFNGDGAPDIAVTNMFDYTVSLLMGFGDGTFDFPNDVDTAPLPAFLVADDVNRDGVPDLVVGSFDTISVLLGNPSARGTFGDATFYAMGREIWGLVSADLNGDGTLDLVVTDGDASVLVLRGQGDGTFHLPVRFNANDTPSGVAVADLDGDGRLDIAVTNEFDSTVTVRLNTTTFAPSGVAFTR